MLNNLCDYFRVTYLCDPSIAALEHCAAKVHGGRPRTTTDPESLITSTEVDVIVLCNATCFHASHAILALDNHKYVLVEKPLALNVRDLDAIVDAEKTSQGKVFVAYQRRYAEAFLDAVKEVGGMGKIQYARVRDIIGPNSTFVGQSGTFPRKFTDFKEEDSKEMGSKDYEMLKEALETDYCVEVTREALGMASLLGR